MGSILTSVYRAEEEELNEDYESSTKDISYSTKPLTSTLGTQKEKLTLTSLDEKKPFNPPVARKTSTSRIDVRTSSASNTKDQTNRLSITPPKGPKTEEEIEKVLQVGMQKLADMKSVAYLSRNLEGKRFLARNLVLKEHLLKYYLSLDLVPALSNMLTSPPPEQRLTNESSDPLSTTCSVEDEEDNDEKSVDTQTMMMNELSKTAPTKEPIMRAEEVLKVKFVIIEMNGTESEKRMRRFLSPIMDTFRLSPTFGLFHSALIVGPWYLEWNNSSLCIPRRCMSGAAVLAADVEAVFRGPQVSVAMDHISDVVCHWNSSIVYSKQKYNCQTFVDELCKALDIKLNFQGALAEFLKHLRYSGVCELSYTPKPEVLKQIGRENETNVQFKSHRELDDFVNSVRDRMPTYFDLDEAGVDDWKLLKSFDRAFWLRKFKHGTEQYEPHNCPFKNPLESGSILDWKCK
jgi:hypothetical protein